MISETAIEQTLEGIFSSIEFTAQPAGLYDPLRYMIAIGGKRIRPRLCLTTYALYKDAFGDGVCEAASALEVFHSFTLIHDDIMDNAPIRRGVPTVWKKWDANTAILSGDVMSIDSYRRLSALNPSALPEALKIFNAMAAGVCEGQQYDMEFETMEKVSMDEYIRMIGLKTAILIATAAKLGAVAAGAPQKDCDLLFDYGFALGLAFQIEDDYLDTFGDVKTFGKAIGGDILNNKKTWLLIKAMEKDPEATAAAIAMPSGTPEQDARKIACVTELYRSLGVDTDAKAEIRKYHAEAMAKIDELGLGNIRSELLSRYAASLVGRSK